MVHGKDKTKTKAHAAEYKCCDPINYEHDKADLVVEAGVSIYVCNHYLHGCVPSLGLRDLSQAHG